MRVEIAESRGFCFGVERAVSRILSFLEKGRRVYTDGDVVHNRRVMEHLLSRGLEIVDLSKLEPPVDGIFAIRAHGVKPDVERRVREIFEEVVDLTCPIVERLFERARECFEGGWRVVVFGREDHAEMIALRGHVSEALTVSSARALDFDRICVLSQTTSSWKEFSDFVAELIELNPNLREMRVVNTICSVTVERERETERLAKECDVVVVVGGRHSANTGKLFRVASRFTRVIWIESPNELKDSDLEGVECVGVVSGTSTPNRDVEEVAERISLGGKTDG